MTSTRSTRPASVATAPADREDQIDAVARELRAALEPVLRAAAGGDPRPMKLARAIDIDKSLASVLIRAINAKSDRDLLHFVPSPTGLRILAEQSKEVASRGATARLVAATESFRRLLEATPGGRAALDANIAESSQDLGRRRESTSRQAAFKAMSFLLGYYGDAMASTLVLIPSEDGRMVDGIEIVRRLGVRRMRSSATIPLFSFDPWPEEAPDLPSSRLDPLTPDPAGPRPSNLLLSGYSTFPLPEVEVVSEGGSTIVVLPGRRAAEGAMDFTWSFRLRNGGPPAPDAGVHVLHGYGMTMPTRRVVRDVYIAEGVYPGATPLVTWAVSGTRHHEHPPGRGDRPHYAQVEIAAEFEPLADGRNEFAVPGMPGQERLVADVLERVGHADTRFRGWRCTLNYPVPLIDMYVWLAHVAPLRT